MNLTATFDNPVQASVNVPVNKVTFLNDSLYSAMDFAGLTYVGAMNYGVPRLFRDQRSEKRKVKSEQFLTNGYLTLDAGFYFIG